MLIDDKEYKVSTLLTGFTIQPKDSTNIEFCGYNDENVAFIQFKAGSTYFYKVDILKDWASFINGGFYKSPVFKKLYKKLINPKATS